MPRLAIVLAYTEDNIEYSDVIDFDEAETKTLLESGLDLFVAKLSDQIRNRLIKVYKVGELIENSSN